MVVRDRHAGEAVRAQLVCHRCAFGETPAACVVSGPRGGGRSGTAEERIAGRLTALHTSTEVDALDASERAELRRLVDRAVRERLRRAGVVRVPGLCVEYGGPDGEVTPGCQPCRRRAAYRRRREQAQRVELMQLAELLGLEPTSNGARANGRPR
jgi:hypothetical protein